MGLVRKSKNSNGLMDSSIRSIASYVGILPLADLVFTMGNSQYWISSAYIGFVKAIRFLNGELSSSNHLGGAIPRFTWQSTVFQGIFYTNVLFIAFITFFDYIRDSVRDFLVCRSRHGKTFSKGIIKRERFC